MSERAGALLRLVRARPPAAAVAATRDPYALLVTEVMLQQTQAARVVPYYERVPGALPGPGARSPPRPRADVLAAWSGLGYNRRALALQRAAARRRRARLAGRPDASSRASARTPRPPSPRSRGTRRSRPSTPTPAA